MKYPFFDIPILFTSSTGVDRLGVFGWLGKEHEEDELKRNEKRSALGTYILTIGIRFSYTLLHLKLICYSSRCESLVSASYT